ncbi:TIGR04283 family arsenosugar biosynthesis glycosyltransferase [Nodosilinea sp. E11]|uniref:TIGR04283 family arsenosugar biosynthesis glycosyltransferase n=1 Tax=Nodosilinea sp. E11 TaxID=3037479 RepID=UPI0029351A43|nr:TIGR04283 family arsenosugar biosynthesis glycosyltransferase [Nodosilinea sp. E11]WOD41214.1 TIGR04283 family arsenosugar biosynthesis glycosyltransferase [Nodosilinea sp. E11]
MPPSPARLWNVERIQALVKRSLGWVSELRPIPSASDRDLAAVRTTLVSPPAPISIVIPTLNEVEQLPTVLAAIPTGIEVVVVDGGSTDRTDALANALGVRVIASPPGRSRQLNRGAAAATGDILLFLHADTRLPEGFDQAIRQTLAQPGVVAGAFRLAIDSPRRSLRWVEWGVNLRSRWLQMPYGDQAIFLPAEVFHQLGGFPDLPMMEDFELVRRLRKLGKVAIAPATVMTSDRRWRTLGVLRTTLTNQLMIIGYFLGIDPQKLARWYRNLGKPR